MGNRISVQFEQRMEEWSGPTQRKMKYVRSVAIFHHNAGEQFANFVFEDLGCFLNNFGGFGKVFGRCFGDLGPFLLFKIKIFYKKKKREMNGFGSPRLRFGRTWVES